MEIDKLLYIGTSFAVGWWTAYFAYIVYQRKKDK